MEVVKVLLASVLSIVIIFVLTKLMGNKQISQLNMFDYIVGITIGSIAAEMATELEGALKPVIAMIVYGVTALLVSLLTNCSNCFRKFMTGKPVIMLENNVIYRSRLKKARLDINEFLAMARIAGYFDISQIETAVFEENGSLTFQPKAQYHSVTPKDMGLTVSKEDLPVNIIVDGNIMEHELGLAGKDRAWLESRLRKSGYKSPREIFLAILKHDGTISFFPSQDKSSS